MYGNYLLAHFTVVCDRIDLLCNDPLFTGRKIECPPPPGNSAEADPTRFGSYLRSGAKGLHRLHVDRVGLPESLACPPKASPPGSPGRRASNDSEARESGPAEARKQPSSSQWAVVLSHDICNRPPLNYPLPPPP